MMKHDTPSKPMPISHHNNNNNNSSKNNNNMIVPTAIANSPSSGKRSLWRTRSSSEAPTGPRSPITKAFDFLPWSRSKKNSTAGGGGGGGEKATNTNTTTMSMPSPPPTGGGSSVVVDEDNNNKKDCIHYHRNIFRNGGGLIRDILGDKLNKDKQPSGQSGQGALGQPKKGSGAASPRKPKQVVARNKSLDIHELINCVENELAAEGKRGVGGRGRFLDDTFIENILRAKGGGAGGDHNNRLSQHQQDDLHHGEIYANEAMHAGGNNNNNNNNNNNSDNGGHHPSAAKHILFNDENVVYLIKKELPVKREASRTKAAAAALLEQGGSKTLPRTSSLSSSSTAAAAAMSEKVLKARLKLKKLTPEATSQPQSESRSPAQQQQQRSYLQSKSVIDNCAVIGLGGIGLSLNGVGGGGSGGGKRSILQRQNTMPAGIHGGHHHDYDYHDYDPHQQHHHHQSHRRVDSPDPVRRTDGGEGGRRQHQLFQRAEQRAQMVRRRSLTDTSFENSSLFDNSSSSSMGSGGPGGGGGGIIVERPKTDKPRKKLSFREPVVSEKTRSRRRSSPLQRSLGGSAASIVGGVAVNNNNNSSNNNTANTNNNGTIANGNCDNLSKLLESRYVARGGGHGAGVEPSFAAAAADGGQDQQDPESQAMRIVRTVGQAFEVCHKFNLHKNSLDNNDERSDVSSDLLDVEHISEHQLSDDEVAKKDQTAVTPDLNPPQRPNHLELVPQSNMNIRKSPSVLTDEDKSPTTPSSPSREIHKLKDQLEQQALQTRQALAQLMLVREQLISETNARIEAQARTQQLLQQNRELLEHLASLGAYTEQQTPGLTSANIAMAPQSQLQMLLQATSNNNNLATINQQINNLGSINQQLTSLSHQLSGLNQQSQNLQNLKNMNVNVNLQQQQQHQQHHHQQHQHQQQHQQSLTPPTPSASLHQSQLHLNVSAANTSSGSPGPLSSSPFPSMNQLQSISTQLQNMSLQSSQQQAQQQQDALSKDLFQVNQELLNRLQALNLGAAANSAGAALALNGSPLPQTTQQQQTPSPHSSFFFVNPMSCSPTATATTTMNNNNSPSNFNFLASPGSLGATSGNLTPSPMGTLSRNSFSNSTTINDELGLSIDQNLNALDEHLIKPLAQMCPATSNGNIASGGGGGAGHGSAGNSRSSSTIDSPSSPSTRNNSHHNNNNNNNNMGNEPRFNTVMLKVTDEAGNVTNQRKLSATPSFITRSTSEKVPNRSQMMSQVQRTAWARHTTK